MVSSCPGCGGQDWHTEFEVPEMFTGEVFAIERCEGCRLLRTAGDPTPEEIARYYDTTAAGADAGSRFRGVIEPLMRALRRRRLREVFAIRKEPGRILDVGCGRGVMLKALAEHGWDAHGIELAPEIAATARRSLGDHIYTTPIEDADLEPGSFDVISFWHVLEHLPNPLSALERARELLAPGGVILISVPNRDSWQARLFGPHWLHLDPPRHRWHFTPVTLEKVAQRAGLSWGTVSYFSFEYGPFGMLQSALSRAGLGHTLFTRVLRAGGRRRPWQNPYAWAHLALALPISAAAIASFPLEIFAAAAGRGGILTVVLRTR